MMKKPLIYNGNPVQSVGFSAAWYDPTIGVHLQTVRFGRRGGVECHAAGSLVVNMSVLRDTVANSLRFIAEEALTRNALHALDPVADALTALRLAVEAHKGVKTSARWWRRHYWALVAGVHAEILPSVALPENPHAARRVAATNPATGGVVSLQAVLVERRRAAAEQARVEAERARIAAHIREGAGGQLEIAL